MGLRFLDTLQSEHLSTLKSSFQLLLQSTSDGSGCSSGCVGGVADFDDVSVEGSDDSGAFGDDSVGDIDTGDGSAHSGLVICCLCL